LPGATSWREGLRPTAKPLAIGVKRGYSPRADGGRGRQHPKREMQVKHVIRSMAVVVTLAASALTVMATPAAATVRSGNVYCWADYQNVVGIWVEVSGGGSGWAQWSGNTSSSSTWWRYDVPSGRSYRLHVGCGGTKQNWRTNTRCGWTTKTTSSNWSIVYVYGSRVCRAT